jgi:hypothetical protein
MPLPFYAPRGSADSWVNLCLARVPAHCALSGPSAMCFLRAAQGFGWLDPSLKRSRHYDAPLPSPRPPLRSSQKRRFAAETWGMRDDAPPISRLAQKRANPWRLDLRLDPSLKRSRHNAVRFPPPSASLRSSLKRRSAAEVRGMRDDAPSLRARPGPFHLDSQRPWRYTIPP